MKDYEKTYEDFWKDIVEEDGKIKLDQIKRELHDYHYMITEIPKLYCSITQSKISKPLTHIHHIEEIVDQRIEDSYDEGFEDAKEQYKEVN